MLRKLHNNIFEFMRYKPFMKPFVIGMHIMIVLVAVINIFLVGQDYSLRYYLINVVAITVLGHVGLKFWEIIYVQMLKIMGINR